MMPINHDILIAYLLKGKHSYPKNPLTYYKRHYANLYTIIIIIIISISPHVPSAKEIKSERFSEGYHWQTQLCYCELFVL